jgi:hypothetical protein
MNQFVEVTFEAWLKDYSTLPVAGHERFALLGVTWTSYPVKAGHIVTPRDHYCGEFLDTYDWSKH